MERLYGCVISLIGAAQLAVTERKAKCHKQRLYGRVQESHARYTDEPQRGEQAGTNPDKRVRIVGLKNDISRKRTKKQPQHIGFAETALKPPHKRSENCAYG